LAIVVDITQVLQALREHTDRVAMILLQGQTPVVENPTATMGITKNAIITNTQDRLCATSAMLHHRDTNKTVVTAMKIMANYSSNGMDKLLLNVPTTMKSTQDIQMTTGNTDLQIFMHEESNMVNQVGMQVIVRKNKGANQGMLNHIINTGNK
jgi:hypothetical protein